MPCYNERATIREIVSRVLSVDRAGHRERTGHFDDGSKDGIADILAEIDGRDGVRVPLQPRNEGKGRRSRAAFANRPATSSRHPGRRPRA